MNFLLPVGYATVGMLFARTRARSLEDTGPDKATYGMRWNELTYGELSVMSARARDFSSPHSKQFRRVYELGGPHGQVYPWEPDVLARRKKWLAQIVRLARSTTPSDRQPTVTWIYSDDLPLGIRKRCIPVDPQANRLRVRRQEHANVTQGAPFVGERLGRGWRRGFFAGPHPPKQQP